MYSQILAQQTQSVVESSVHWYTPADGTVARYTSQKHEVYVDALL